MDAQQFETFKKAKAIERANKQKWVKHFGSIPDTSGVYVLRRYENGFKYAYIGQAKHILTRLAQHLKGYQHIDLSLKKHGLFCDENALGWDLCFYLQDQSELNEMEQFFIKEYANRGFQLYNHTTGSQGVGKRVLGDQKERKGYNQGLNNGYEKARKEIAKLFEKNLTYTINGKPNKNKEKALQKFKDFLQNFE